EIEQLEGHYKKKSQASETKASARQNQNKSKAKLKQKQSKTRARVSNDEILPSNDETLPSNDKTLPSNDETLPSNDEILPSNNETLPSNNKIMLSSNDTVLSNNNLHSFSQQTIASPFVRQVFKIWEDFDKYLQEYACKSKRTGCLWHVNATFPKKATTISITSLNINHNHLLDPETNLYAVKNRILPKAVERKVCFYMAEGNLNAMIQRRLLSAKFPDVTIYLRDLQNLIQKYKIANREENDASKLLKQLLNKKTEELGWEAAIYLNSELYSNKERWAKAYTNKFFTAGISSTSRVESKNATIKKVLQGHPSLCELATILDLRGASAECFPEVDCILKEHLTEEMLSRQRHEITQSLYYYTVIEDEELPNKKHTEESYDTQQIHLTSLLEDLPPNDIVKVYKIQQYHCVHVNYVIILVDYSHLCTCMLLVNSGLVCRHFWHIFAIDSKVFFHITLIPRRWYSNEKMQDLNLDEQLYIINTGLAPSNEGSLPCPALFPMHLIARIHEQRLTQINNNNKENLDPEQVKNPIERQHKGRPSVKWFKSSIEQVRSKKPQNKCGKCGVIGLFGLTLSVVVLPVDNRKEKDQKGYRKRKKDTDSSSEVRDIRLLRFVDMKGDGTKGYKKVNQSNSENLKPTKCSSPENYHRKGIVVIFKEDEEVRAIGEKSSVKMDLMVKQSGKINMREQGYKSGKMITWLIKVVTKT
ncbi:6924_t:CDS:2, partial [Scutellospora calospora]